jgi:hypothetical protein
MTNFTFSPFFRVLGLAIAMAGALPAQNNLAWTPPLAVAPASFGNFSPRLAVQPDGSPLVVWGNSGVSEPEIRLARWENGVFSAPALISTGSVLPDIYIFGGLDLAVAGDRVYVVFEDFSTGIHLVTSEDGAQTFLDPVKVFTPGPGQFATLAGMKTDGAGNPVIAYIHELTNETEAVYRVSRSTDGGISFLPSANASDAAAGDFVCECCYPDLVTAGDTIWLAFRNNMNNLRDMWVTRSTDGGASFPAAADVDATDWVINACPISGPQLQRLSGDTLLSVWMSRGEGSARVYGSTVNGVTMEKGWEWAFPVTGMSPTAPVQQNHPDVAGSGDTTGVVWEETGFGTNGQDLLFAFSTLGSAGLAGSQPVNLTQAAGTQRYPQLAYRDGVFHLLYADAASGQIWYRRGEIVLDAEAPAADEPGFRVSTRPATAELLVWPTGLAAGTASARLFDVFGKPVGQWSALPVEGQEPLALPVHDLPGGTYFLTINYRGGAQTLRVVYLP